GAQPTTTTSSESCRRNYERPRSSWARPPASSRDRSRGCCGAAALSPTSETGSRRRYKRSVRGRRSAFMADRRKKLRLLPEFRRAYELTPVYKILFNVGQTNLQLNNYADALSAFETYLAAGGAEIPAKRRAAVEKDIAELQRKTASITVTVANALEDVDILV